jgi:hypothetical protein
MILPFAKNIQFQSEINEICIRSIAGMMTGKMEVLVEKPVPASVHLPQFPH